MPSFLEIEVDVSYAINFIKGEDISGPPYTSRAPDRVLETNGGARWEILRISFLTFLRYWQAIRKIAKKLVCRRRFFRQYFWSWI